jgi:hypothetical protein
LQVKEGATDFTQTILANLYFYYVALLSNFNPVIFNEEPIP